jgi:putative ABC transport system substrate-binding protein
MQFGHLKRREFITLFGGAAAWPRAVRGEFKPTIIGVLGSSSAESGAFLIGALKEGMNENGLAEGRDYIERRRPIREIPFLRG